jgi:hypothetical protein
MTEFAFHKKSKANARKQKFLRTAASFSDTGSDPLGCGQQVGSKEPSQPYFKKLEPAQTNTRTSIL